MFILGLATIESAIAQVPPTPTASRLVSVRAGRLFDGQGDALANDVRILVEGDRISKVGLASQLALPEGVREIDLRGMTILPGLIDCHTHLSMRADRYDPIYKFKDTPFQRAFAAVLHAETTLKAGFTTV